MTKSTKTKTSHQLKNKIILHNRKEGTTFPLYNGQWLHLEGSTGNESYARCEFINDFQIRLANDVWDIYNLQECMDKAEINLSPELLTDEKEASWGAEEKYLLLITKGDTEYYYRLVYSVPNVYDAKDMLICLKMGKIMGRNMPITEARNYILKQFNLDEYGMHPINPQVAKKFIEAKEKYKMDLNAFK